MTPFEYQDTLDDIREAQRIVLLSGWLRGRSGAAKVRLEDARGREAELFKIVLQGPNPPSHEKEYEQAWHRKKKEDATAARQSHDMDAASEA